MQQLQAFRLAALRLYTVLQLLVPLLLFRRLKSGPLEL